MGIIPVIISGGVGSRLWPLSRKKYPKPFLPLGESGTLIGATYARAAGLDGVKTIITVTNRDLLHLTDDAYAAVAASGVSNAFILEPFGRDTAAAIALATLHAGQAHGPDAVLLILPADHMITDTAAFAHGVERAEELADQGRIVTFGIPPDRPETGFGYIETDGGDVLGFVEKPDADTAADYVASGRFLWNSGMFCFSAGTMLNALEAHCADILSATRAALEAAQVSTSGDRLDIGVDAETFATVRAHSIDYAVMEKAENLACVPVSCGWSDIGSWGAMAELAPGDGKDNHAGGQAILQGSRNCYVDARDNLVGLVGVDDLVVVATPDATLVARKDHAHAVKDLFAQLEEQDRPEAVEHRTVRRPWGSYTVLEEGAGYKVKRIEVKPGGRLSLQSHKHRSEHWTVVRGVAIVVNGDETLTLAANQSTYIPCGAKHRLENRGEETMALIEVQCGDYLGEDDIVRYDDIYGRS